MEIQDLVGKKVLSAKINSTNDIVALDTDKGTLYLSWYGDCCAHCFLANVSGVDALIGSTILEAQNTDWTYVKRNEDDYDVTETMGTKLKTTKGYVDFESRVEHNGYYGGSLEVSEKGPNDQYGDFKDLKEEKFKKLEDF